MWCFTCRHVFISQKAYQETETRPESSVYTEMRGVAMLGDSVQDTTEYVRPSEVINDIILLQDRADILSHFRYCKVIKSNVPC